MTISPCAPGAGSTSVARPKPTPRSRLRLAAVSTAAILTIAAGAGTAAVLRAPAPPSSRTPESVVPHTRPTATRDDAVDVDDGVLPDGASVFGDRYPGVTDLDPTLREALRGAAQEASLVDITFVVNSGWRSRAYQDQLWREAVAEYGSPEEAARWVATADNSAHVSGDAVDIGPADAANWLSEHGSGYGLCRVYDNEPWHFELRPTAPDRGCPPTYADPTDDPRTGR